MKTTFKLGTEMVLELERPLIDIQSSLLNTFVKALKRNLEKDLDEVNPLHEMLIKETWREQLKGLERELILRN
jgi:hypothetical protein